MMGKLDRAGDEITFAVKALVLVHCHCEIKYGRTSIPSVATVYPKDICYLSRWILYNPAREVYVCNSASTAIYELNLKLVLRLGCRISAVVTTTD